MSAYKYLYVDTTLLGFIANYTLITQYELDYYIFQNDIKY